MSTHFLFFFQSVAAEVVQEGDFKKEEEINAECHEVQTEMRFNPVLVAFKLNRYFTI